MNKYVKILISRFSGSSEAKNASWLIGGKIIQMLLSVVVGALVARFIGPANNGLIDYASSYIVFFTSLCTLGINSVIVKNFVDHPDEEGETIGTTLILRLISSALSCVTMFFISSLVDADEPLTILIVSLCSLQLIFHIADTFNYWFQSRYLSKRTAVGTLIAYAITSAYKIILLICGADVVWFALANTFDLLAYAVIIYFFFKKDGGPKMTASFAKAKQLLSTSYHFILSGIMIAIYGSTDKFMLKQMMDEVAVSYYSRATVICSMWTFVLQAIIDSLYPAIMQLFKVSKDAFERKNRQLYAIVFYTAVAVSIVFTLGGELIVDILYGESYAGAAAPLKIITWYTAFAFLGVARNAWIVCENKQKYLKYMYLSAAVINIGLNAIFIPLWGPSGAAFASLITQIFTSIILPFFFKDIRRNSVLILEAITLKGIIRK